MKKHIKGKTRKKIVVGVICATLALVVSMGAIGAGTSKDKAFALSDETEFRGVWVPAIYNLAYPSKPTQNVATLKKEADTVLDQAKDLGFNAVFFQARPASDALYQSTIYPWSSYLTGTQGVAPGEGFDPLQYYIDGAHARGLELHAWVNPYRITTDAGQINSLATNNPALLHPELVVKYTNGALYYNPGEPKARQLVIDGIAEIINNYDVDGIHLDDYFYPGADFGDEATFAKYGGTFKNIGDWRRNNNDVLIQSIHTTIQAKNKNIEFGVSPFGIWANEKNNSLGSATNGRESYYAEFADTRKWVKEAYVDYIMPQIYWSVGEKAADYTILSNWWSDVVKGTNVDLRVGMAAYKTNNAPANSPWYSGAEIKKQLDLNRANPFIDGYSMYAYQSILKDANLYRVIQKANLAQIALEEGNGATPPPVQNTADAVVSSMKVLIDGKEVPFQAYNIGGNNYFKLRDVAYSLKDTAKAFEVIWDQEKQAINMYRLKAYTPIGGEMAVSSTVQSVKAIEMQPKTYVDGAQAKLTTYNIKDNNYIKLRDLGATFDFITDWDNDSRTLLIKTK
ncbi:MAG: family 10 glycosylhydrolase [Anaerovorax sp.]